MTQNSYANTLLKWKLWSPALIASAFLIIIAQYNFLAFHTLAELFAIIVSFIMFAFAWSTKHFIRNNFLLFLACGYFWIGSLDLLHTLTYKGMDMITHDHGNVAVQFWIGTRYLEAFTLLLAPFAVNKTISPVRLFFGFGVISLVLSMLVFSGHFPAGFIDGQGLTPFKIYSEYLIDFILLIALFCLFKFGSDIHEREKILIAASIVMTMIAEIAFTFYIDVYGLSNLIGHLFKLGSFWLIFNAISISNIKKPYAELKKSERRFRRLFENTEVSLWNVDFSNVYQELNLLRNQGIKDLRSHLAHNREITPQLINMLQVTHINEATLKLFASRDPEKIIRAFPTRLFIDQLCAIWNNEPYFRAETRCITPDGQELNTIISFQLPSKAEDYDNLPISVIDITQRKQDEERIWQQANFDVLTGLANRSYFTDNVSHAIDLAERNREKLAIFYIDLDRFKLVNDTLGHSFGDLLLQEAAQRLLSGLRKTDIAARLAGDEFAVLLPNVIKAEDIEPVIGPLLESLAAPYNLEGNEAYVSASIGVALFPNDGDNVSELLRKADSAMYKAKEDGRNNYHFFTLELELEAQHKRHMEQELRKALSNQEFTLHYQPIHNLESQVTSAEALVRWEQPGKGIIPPIEFIPLAEELNLITPLGEWILRDACRTAIFWHEISPTPPKVSVNVSCKQFQNQDLPELVDSILLETGLPAEQLILEITESLLITDEESTLKQLQELRSMGVELSVDDFGTGYSSLSYLKKFPINTLKIDRSFIDDIPNDQEDIALVKAIMSMAESLKLKVVAEGVETPAQAAFLQSRNCTYIQGYFLSKPLPSNDFIQYLRDRI